MLKLKLMDGIVSPVCLVEGRFSCFGDGINRSKFNLFENMVIVAYQIKGITKCSNTVANIMAADPLPPPKD